MIRSLIGAMLITTLIDAAVAAEPTEIRLGYLAPAKVPQTLSLVEQPANNDGFAGARLAIDDNNTTGQFTDQHFAMEEIRLKA